MDRESISAIVAETVKQLQAKRPADSSGLTLGQFFRQYIDGYASVHTRSAQHFEQTFRLYLSPWANRLLSGISRSDVIELQTGLAKEKSKDVANKAIELLSILYNKAIDWELFNGTNPAARVKKFRKQSRERFLQADELPRFIAAVKALRYQTATDFFLMLLFTGQRRRNVGEMRWDEIDFARGVWRIPHTKNGTSHQVPLVREALEILEHRRSGSDKHADWVFPKRDGSGPVWCLDMAWRSVLQRAEIQDLRIHDLRRSHASWQAINGTSTAIIGATLNHKDPKSTMIYARLCIDPIKDAMQEAVSAMLTAGQEEQPSSLRVVPAKKFPALKLVSRDKERPDRQTSAIPKNASVKISAAEQAIIEAKITKVLAIAPCSKSRFYRALGGFKLNGAELQRILDEMVARGILSRYRGAPYWAVWQYALAPSANAANLAN